MADHFLPEPASGDDVAKIPDNQPGIFALVTSFLATPAGAALNEKLAQWVGGLSDGQKAKQDREAWAEKARFVLMGLVLVVAATLQLVGKLDSAIVGLLGLALGYLFGRQRNDE